MIQWYRGELEASYVGTRNAQPYLGAHAAGTHFKLTVYRAALKNLERVEPPAPDSTSQTQASFHQARVDDALIAGVHGPGTSYQGPVFALHVSEPRFSHAVQKDGRAYGRLTGRALLYCDLPPEPERPLVQTVITEAPAAPGETPDSEEKPEPVRAELRKVGSDGAQASRVDNGASKLASGSEQTDDEPSEVSTAPARVATRRTDSAAPLFALAAAVALGLWASCGAAAALLWCMFLLPTLVARKLFHGVLNDSPYIRGFGALLAIGQLLCVSTLVSEWWSVPCKELHVLPLIGIVVVIFPAGILPSVLPLLFNASGLALVLAVWCGGDRGACTKTRENPGAFAPASVEHPGVPRTNQDGTWPRRPPGR